MSGACFLLLGIAIGVVFGIALGMNASTQNITNEMKLLLRDAVGNVQNGESYYMSVSVGKMDDEGDGGNGDDESNLSPFDETMEQEYQWQ